MGDQRDQAQTNGADSTKNGMNGSEDVEMEEDTAGGPTSSFNANKDRKGDQKMTVVVPPTKGSRVSGDKGQDQEGDMSMEGTEGEEPVSEIDPRTKAIQGLLSPYNWIRCSSLIGLFFYATQISRQTSRFSNALSPISIPGSLSAS